MAYTILDLLDKLVEIEKNSADLYRQVGILNGNPAFRNVANTLALEEERHVEFYRSLKTEYQGYRDISIDFDIYDKASSLIQQFYRHMALPECTDVKELLRFALELETNNIALLLDIQGRLVRNDGSAYKEVYQALTRLIDQEHKHLDNLRPFADI